MHMGLWLVISCEYFDVRIDVWLDKTPTYSTTLVCGVACGWLKAKYAFKSRIYFGVYIYRLLIGPLCAYKLLVMLQRLHAIAFCWIKVTYTL